MAIGISWMLNLDLPVNFDSPYKAYSVVEFWKRWHISLTRFLTKYIYIPLGGSRKGNLRTYCNTMIVFLCSGIWHGASWMFVLWGALHGVAMVLTKALKRYGEWIPRILKRSVTLLFINFTWIIFRTADLKELREVFRAFLKRWDFDQSRPVSVFWNSRKPDWRICDSVQYSASFFCNRNFSFSVNCSKCQRGSRKK